VLVKKDEEQNHDNYNYDDDDNNNNNDSMEQSLPEKITGSQVVKKFLAFCGTLKFITASTTVRHLSLS
jgi:hypothetical protein